MKFAAAVALAPLVALLSCSVIIPDTTAAKQQVTVFHQRLDGAAFGAIYDDTDALYRRRQPRHTSNRMFAAVHRKLGAVRSAVLRQWRVNATTGGTFVSLGYETRFAHGRAFETFLWHQSSTNVRLAGYHIESADMLTN